MPPLALQVMELVDMWSSREGGGATVDKMLEALGQLPECAAIGEKIHRMLN